VPKAALFEKPAAAPDTIFDPVYTAPPQTGDEVLGSDTRYLDFSTAIVEAFKLVLTGEQVSAEERAAHIEAVYAAAGAMVVQPDIETFARELNYPPAVALLEMSASIQVAYDSAEIRLLHRCAMEEI
jgi:hypothetical protein